ncbi:hypothetical protein HY837_00065 [archaeon]|nr:hypothetical protein [archaeon]
MEILMAVLALLSGILSLYNNYLVIFSKYTKKEREQSVLRKFSKVVGALLIFLAKWRNQNR